ncbi:MAG: acetylornithine deacetylase [Candidatus Xenobia bacterium]
MNVTQVLTDLVAVDSVSARSNAPMTTVLEKLLDALGARLERRTWKDEAGVDKINLIARFGPDRPGGLAFVGHTDTVPYDPAWTDALTLRRENGKLVGRGSADTKAFIAALLAALADKSPTSLQQPLMCIFTADEEVGCRGAKRLMEEGDLRPQWAVVGEPTGLVPMRAQKGYCLDDIEVQGLEAHSAYPSVGRSAILHASRVLRCIERIEEELKEDRDASFDPPWTTLNVGMISGGTARNMVPGHCSFPLEWRPIPHQSLNHVEDLVAREVRSLHSNDPSLNVLLHSRRRDPGASVPAEAKIVRLMEQETGKTSGTIAFGTELPYMVGLGAEAVVCGPGDIRVAHRSGEFVPVVELERAVEIYRHVIDTLC